METRGEVSQVIAKKLPGWSLPAICLYAINVGLSLGDGEQACPFLLVDFGVYQAPNVTIGASAVLPAGKYLHAAHGIRRVGYDFYIMEAVPSLEDSQYGVDFCPRYGLPARNLGGKPRLLLNPLAVLVVPEDHGAATGSDGPNPGEAAVVATGATKPCSASDTEDLFESAGGGGPAIQECDPVMLRVYHALSEQAPAPKGEINSAAGGGLSTEVLRFDNVKVVTEGVVGASPETVEESLKLEAASWA